MKQVYGMLLSTPSVSFVTFLEPVLFKCLSLNDNESKPFSSCDFSVYMDLRLDTFYMGFYHVAFLVILDVPLFTLFLNIWTYVFNRIPFRILNTKIPTVSKWYLWKSQSPETRVISTVEYRALSKFATVHVPWLMITLCDYF